MEGDPSAIVTITTGTIQSPRGSHKHLLTLYVECICGCTQLELFELHGSPKSLLVEDMWDSDCDRARVNDGDVLVPRQEQRG